MADDALDSEAEAAMAAIDAHDAARAVLHAHLSPSFWTSDGRVIKLAHLVADRLEAASAVKLLRANDHPGRAGNYKYALGYFLTLTGDWRGAATATQDVRIQCCEDVRYLVASIRMRVKSGDLARAIGDAQSRCAMAARSVWASMMIVRCLSAFPEAMHVLTPLFGTLEDAGGELTPEDQINLGFCHAQAFRSMPGFTGKLAAGGAALEMAGFTLRHGLAESVRMADELVGCGSFRNEAGVFAAAESALRGGRGMSIVRLGDGEGRFLPPLTEYPELYKASLSKAREVWFWNSRSMPGQEFFDGFADAVRSADIVGFSPALRVEMEAANSYLGYLGVVNGNSFVADQLRLRDRAITYNWINILLETSGLLDKLVDIAGEVSVISPYPDIRVNGRFAGRDIRHFVIPSENNKAVVGQSVKEPHYPDVYLRLCDELARAGTGLFLIAGGIFGKIYCAKVRQAGGVAIDMGSVADQWVGLKTR